MKTSHVAGKAHGGLDGTGGIKHQVFNLTDKVQSLDAVSAGIKGARDRGGAKTGLNVPLDFFDLFDVKVADFPPVIAKHVVQLLQAELLNRLSRDSNRDVWRHAASPVVVSLHLPGGASSLKGFGVNAGSLSRTVLDQIPEAACLSISDGINCHKHRRKRCSELGKCAHCSRPNPEIKPSLVTASNRASHFHVIQHSGVADLDEDGSTLNANGDGLSWILVVLERNANLSRGIAKRALELVANVASLDRRRVDLPQGRVWIVPDKSEEQPVDLILLCQNNGIGIVFEDVLKNLTSLGLATFGNLHKRITRVKPSGRADSKTLTTVGINQLKATKRNIVGVLGLPLRDRLLVNQAIREQVLLSHPGDGLEPGGNGAEVCKIWACPKGRQDLSCFGVCHARAAIGWELAEVSGLND